MLNKILNRKKCFDFLYKFCQKYFSFYEELSEILSKMYIDLHVKYRLFLSDFKVNRIFSRFSKIAQISNFMPIRPVGVELFHADRRTDMSKLTVAFRNSA